MKTIILSVSIVLCASMFTSCRSDYERAYEAESMYRLQKRGIWKNQILQNTKKSLNVSTDVCLKV